MFVPVGSLKMIMIEQICGTKSLTCLSGKRPWQKCQFRAVFLSLKSGPRIQFDIDLNKETKIVIHEI